MLISQVAQLQYSGDGEEGVYLREKKVTGQNFGY